MAAHLHPRYVLCWCVEGTAKTLLSRNAAAQLGSTD
jgi:hypothetical protein